MSDDVEKLVHIGYGAFNAGERIPSLDHCTPMASTSTTPETRTRRPVTYEDGKIRRIEEYSDRSEALHAAGVRE